MNEIIERAIIVEQMYQLTKKSFIFAYACREVNPIILSAEQCTNVMNNWAKANEIKCNTPDKILESMHNLCIDILNNEDDGV